MSRAAPSEGRPRRPIIGPMEGEGRVLTPRERAAERPPGEPTSPERVAWIVGLESDPVRRNLLITQCYHDLSAALGKRLGAEHANWCTFATWASRTAGRFIRDEEVPAAFRDVLTGSTHLDRGIERANLALGRFHADAAIPKDVVLDIARRIVHEVGELITRGNLAVFSELGPVFAQAIAALDEDGDGAALRRLGETLTEGSSDRGGQTRLRLALNGYARARSEPSPHRQAELMLLANARIGLHEQIRLQPFIAGSIEAPVRLALLDPADEAARRLPRGLRTLCRGALRLALRDASKAVERHWEELCTRELMTLQLPGRDAPPRPAAPSPEGAAALPRAARSDRRPRDVGLPAPAGRRPPGAPGRRGQLDGARRPDALHRRPVSVAPAGRRAAGWAVHGRPAAAVQRGPARDGTALSSRRRPHGPQRPCGFSRDVN